MEIPRQKGVQCCFYVTHTSTHMHTVQKKVSKINITGINLHFYTFFNSFWKKRYINVIPCRENYIKKLQSLEIRNCHKSARKTNLQIRYIEIKI